MIINLNKYIFLAAGFLTALFSHCTFNADNNTPLTLKRIDTNGDTLTTFPSLRFAFSEPVMDNEIEMLLVPDCSGYHTEINDTKDSFDLIVTGMLKGQTLYTAFLAETATSINGATLSTGGEGFSFFTHSAESEPNDSKDPANLFYSPVCGAIENTGDTDYYYLSGTSLQSIYVHSADGSALGLGLVNNSGYDTVLTGSEPKKNLVIPGNFSFPGFIRIFSLNSTGHYELGAR
jgi:hypothetical protein